MKRCLALLSLLLVAAQDAPPKDPAPPPDPFIVKVTDMVRARLAANIGLATGTKVKFEDAVAKASKLEETILAESAEKLEISVDQVKEVWAKRERKPHKVQYGDGSWIVLGGQDGGLDSSVKGTPVKEELIPSGPSILTRRKPAPGEPVPLGAPLKTREEWWTSSSSAERSAFVEGEFVRKSGLVEKKEESKKCSKCSAKGTVNAIRGGIGLVCVCPRCHGAKEDVIVQYE
jgi:hypothetical protein